MELVDKFREECGVFGIYGHPEAANMTYLGLHALQHRGQESAGIATTDGFRIYRHGQMGLVNDIFTPGVIDKLPGTLAIGHNRYSTCGSSYLRNAQPYLIETALGPLGIAHNGNLTNAPALRRELLDRGVGLVSSSDSEVITQMLAGATGGTWDERIADLCKRPRAPTR